MVFNTDALHVCKYNLNDVRGLEVIFCYKLGWDLFTLRGFELDYHPEHSDVPYVMLQDCLYG